MEYDFGQRDLEEFLLEYIENNFFIDLQDESEIKISKIIIDLFEDL